MQATKEEWVLEVAYEIVNDVSRDWKNLKTLLTQSMHTHKNVSKQNRKMQLR